MRTANCCPRGHCVLLVGTAGCSAGAVAPAVMVVAVGGGDARFDCKWDAVVGEISVGAAPASSRCGELAGGGGTGAAGNLPVGGVGGGGVEVWHEGVLAVGSLLGGVVVGTC